MALLADADLSGDDDIHTPVDLELILQASSGNSSGDERLEEISNKLASIVELTGWSNDQVRDHLRCDPNGSGDFERTLKVLDAVLRVLNEVAPEADLLEVRRSGLRLVVGAVARLRLLDDPFAATAFVLANARAVRLLNAGDIEQATISVHNAVDGMRLSQAHSDSGANKDTVDRFEAKPWTQAAADDADFILG